MKKCIGILFCAALFSSCVKNTSKDVGKQAGFRPIYSTSTDVNTIKSTPPVAVVNAGKIYVYNNYIFQVESGEGIHIIDNQIPATAQKIGFIQIKGCSEISIKGNYLYSNNFNDLVVINISNINQVSEVSRIKEAFYKNSLGNLPPEPGYFECIDPSKGQVVRWVRDSIVNPKCVL